ncbi:MAG: hypothetical protein HC882_04470 [Acidobacteria bacterium]|nr:hypothetical protein [Acidobacteriota bacterium]
MINTLTANPDAPNADATWAGRRGAISMGLSLALTDINGDGVSDLAMGASNYRELDGSLRFRIYGGVFVEFGGASTSGHTSFVTTTPDYFVRGADDTDRAGRFLGGGDVDGDGTGDLVLGAQGGDGPTTTAPDRGEIYVVFGQAGLTPGTINNLLLTPGTRIHGVSADDIIPSALTVADIDGNGKDDIVVGASAVDGPNPRSLAGRGYVLLDRTRAQWTSTSIDFMADLTVIGRRQSDFLGESVAVGDIDGDGSAEVVFGATGSEGPQLPGKADRGEAIVLAWKDVQFEFVLDLATSILATSIAAPSQVDGMPVSAAFGDVNGDGADGPGAR